MISRFHLLCWRLVYFYGVCAGIFTFAYNFRKKQVFETKPLKLYSSIVGITCSTLQSISIYLTMQSLSLRQEQNVLDTFFMLMLVLLWIVSLTMYWSIWRRSALLADILQESLDIYQTLKLQNLFQLSKILGKGLSNVVVIVDILYFITSTLGMIAFNDGRQSTMLLLAQFWVLHATKFYFKVFLFGIHLNVELSHALHLRAENCVCHLKHLLGNRFNFKLQELCEELNNLSIIYERLIAVTLKWKSIFLDYVLLCLIICFPNIITEVCLR